METWGLVPKSQIDPSTIDEAIAAAIAAHNNDPDAHAGAGQSLDVHRKNDILDHPSASIVPDKLNSANKFIQIATSNLSDIILDNETNFYPGLLARLDKNSPSSGDCFAYLLNFQISDMGYTAGDVLFDFMFSSSFSAGTGQTEFNCNFAKVQLKIGNYRIGYYDGTWHYGAWTAYSQLSAQRWRIFYSAVDGAVYVYLNGVQIFGQVVSLVLETSDYMLTVLLNRGSSSFASAYFGAIDIGFST